MVDCKRKTANLFDKSNTLDGYRVGAAGELVADSSCVLSDFIRVDANTVYTQNVWFNYSNALVEFDENKGFIKRYVSGNGTITTSENTRFIRVSCKKTLVDSYMLNKGSASLPYEQYWVHSLRKYNGNTLVESDARMWDGSEWQ